MSDKKKDSKKGKLAKTYYGIALDSSGSMGRIALEIKNALNAQINTIKEDKEIDASLSLVVFGEGQGDVAVKYINKDINDVQKVDFEPSGLTPMRDGVGTLISQLKALPLGPNDAVAIWVYSDGLENHSKEWSHEALRKEIAALEKTDQWTISYVGANQNSQEVSRGLGMDVTNSLNFDATPTGVVTLQADLEIATRSYSFDRKLGRTKSSNLYGGKTKAGNEDEDNNQGNPSKSTIRTRTLVGSR